MTRSNALIIKVDSDIRELIPGFLENRKSDLLLMRQFLQQNDFESLISIGHKLKGTAAGYGFVFLSDIGIAMEIAGKDQDSAQITRLLAQMDHDLQRVQVVYE